MSSFSRIRIARRMASIVVLAGFLCTIPLSVADSVIISSAFNKTNTSASPVGYAFNFSEPISFSGQVYAYSAINYLLSTLGDNTVGASIAPTSGSNILTAVEYDSTSGTSLNKGVDIFSGYSFSGSGSHFDLLTAANIIPDASGYNSMVVNISFSLSAYSSVGGFFYVEQRTDPVPEPASLILLATGLGTLGLMAWRRKA